MNPTERNGAHMPFPTSRTRNLPGGVTATVVDLGEGDAPTVQFTAPDEPLSLSDLYALADDVFAVAIEIDQGKAA